MKFQLSTFLFFTMALPAIAEPCVLQYKIYNVNAKTQTQTLQICYDTTSKTCRGSAQDAVTKKGAANIINQCTNNAGRIDWKLGTGWTVFGKDLESTTISASVAQNKCSLISAADVQWKLVGLPASLWRHDGGGVSAANSCPF